MFNFNWLFNRQPKNDPFSIAEKAMKENDYDTVLLVAQKLSRSLYRQKFLAQPMFDMLSFVANDPNGDPDEILNSCVHILSHAKTKQLKHDILKLFLEKYRGNVKNEYKGLDFLGVVEGDLDLSHPVAVVMLDKIFDGRHAYDHHFEVIYALKPGSPEKEKAAQYIVNSILAKDHGLQIDVEQDQRDKLGKVLDIIFDKKTKEKDCSLLFAHVLLDYIDQESNLIEKHKMISFIDGQRLNRHFSHSFSEVFMDRIGIRRDKYSESAKNTGIYLKDYFAKPWIHIAGENYRWDYERLATESLAQFVWDNGPVMKDLLLSSMVLRHTEEGSPIHDQAHHDYFKALDQVSDPMLRLKIMYSHLELKQKEGLSFDEGLKDRIKLEIRGIEPIQDRVHFCLNTREVLGQLNTHDTVPIIKDILMETVGSVDHCLDKCAIYSYLVDHSHLKDDGVVDLLGALMENAQHIDDPIEKKFYLHKVFTKTKRNTVLYAFFNEEESIPFNEEVCIPFNEINALAFPLFRESIKNIPDLGDRIGVYQSVLFDNSVGSEEYPFLKDYVELVEKDKSLGNVGLLNFALNKLEEGALSDRVRNLCDEFCHMDSKMDKRMIPEPTRFGAIKHKISKGLDCLMK